ncbi:hypothetical protein C8R44DRAFT_741527 [Mycena epipterygia]|nr:hypothetical protein C8R44DRAFT_741527 [Mycena epipterygia]
MPDLRSAQTHWESGGTSVLRDVPEPARLRMLGMSSVEARMLRIRAGSTSRLQELHDGPHRKVVGSGTALSKDEWLTVKTNALIDCTTPALIIAVLFFSELAARLRQAGKSADCFKRDIELVETHGVVGGARVGGVGSVVLAEVAVRRLVKQVEVLALLGRGAGDKVIKVPLAIWGAGDTVALEVKKKSSRRK